MNHYTDKLNELTAFATDRGWDLLSDDGKTVVFADNGSPKKIVDTDQIILLIRSAVEETTGIKWESIIGKTRYRIIVNARFLLCWFIKHYAPSYGVANMGRLINRDHTSAIHAIKAINNYLYTKDPDIVFLHGGIKAKLEKAGFAV